MIDIVHLLAPNPGTFTGAGTNTYVLRGESDAVILDPGPVIASHRDLIVEAVGDLPVSAVVVTHTHPDHAPMANPLAREYSTSTVGYAHGPEFRADRQVGDGDTVEVGGSTLEVLFTPGHADDHICLLMDTTLFSGDHIIGGSTVMVQDLTRYLASLERLRPVALTSVLPGHGPKIENPHEVIDYYISHRLEREREIVAALEDGAGTVGAVVTSVYADVPEDLHRVAAVSVAAHLRKLVDDGSVVFSTDDATDLWESLISMVATP